MARSRVLKLLERWDAPDNKYSIGTDALSTSTYHMNQVILGPECNSVEELEKIVDDIRSDLDEILTEARDKISSHNAKETKE